MLVTKCLIHVRLAVRMIILVVGTIAWYMYQAVYLLIFRNTLL